MYRFGKAASWARVPTEAPVLSGMEIEQEMEAVADAFTASAKYNLECEVILFALKYAQQNPEAPISECLDAGLAQWVK
jgi:hypothetical protein